MSEHMPSSHQDDSVGQNHFTVESMIAKAQAMPGVEELLNVYRQYAEVFSGADAYVQASTPRQTFTAGSHTI